MLKSRSDLNTGKGLALFVNINQSRETISFTSNIKLILKFKKSLLFSEL